MSLPLRSTFRAAALAVPVALAALGPSNAQVREAQTILAVPPIVMTPPDVAQPLRAIPKEQCNYLFDRVTDKLQKEGPGFISHATKSGFKRFFAFSADGLPTCSGPREIPWESKGRDLDFIVAVSGVVSLAFKLNPNFTAQYGFAPASRPSDQGQAPNQHSEIPQPQG